MQNAHLRLGRLEYVLHTEGTNTHVGLHVDRYMGDGEQAHLLSIFGGDAEVGAIHAAIYENRKPKILATPVRRPIVASCPGALY
jgi:hypothetical protein